MNKKAYSYSQIQTFNSCTMKHYWRYVRQLESKEASSSASIGKAVHAGIAELYKSHLLENAIAAARASLWDFDRTFYNEDRYNDLNKDTLLVEGLVTAYNDTFFVDDMGRGLNNLMVETRCEAILDGVKYETTPDNWFINERGNITITEIKTKSRIDTSIFDKLDIDSQIMLEAILLEKTTGLIVDECLYRIIKRPGIRQTQKETRDEYIARLMAELTDNRGKYLIEFTFRIHDEVKDHARKQLKNSVRMMEYCKRYKRWTCNTMSCSTYGTCEYMNLCKRIEGSEAMYKKREEKRK